MKKFYVTLVVFGQNEPHNVIVNATSAVDACTVAEKQNPGYLAVESKIANA